MTDPFIGEIRLFPYTFAPRGWALCSGQILSIAQHTALFSLIGTIYGGDGRTTFALPDLRGRVAVSSGQGPGLSAYDVGEAGGVELVSLAESQMPAHNHKVKVNGATSGSEKPNNRFLGRVSERHGVRRNGQRQDAESRRSRPLRRGSAAREQAASPHPQLLHRAPGHLPRARLTSLAQHRVTGPLVPALVGQKPLPVSGRQPHISTCHSAAVPRARSGGGRRSGQRVRNGGGRGGSVVHGARGRAVAATHHEGHQDAEEAEDRHHPCGRGQAGGQGAGLRCAVSGLVGDHASRRWWRPGRWPRRRRRTGPCSRHRTPRPPGAPARRPSRLTTRGR